MKYGIGSIVIMKKGHPCGENGVLNITLPKFTEAEKEKAKKFIDVK